MNPSHHGSDEQMVGAAQQVLHRGLVDQANERGQSALSGVILRETIMAEQPVNVSTVPYLGVFSRAEQRVLQAIFKGIADGGGRCVATLAMLARESNTSKTTTRNAIARAVSIGLLEKIERRSYCAVSLPNILTYGEAMMVPHTKATHDLRSREAA
jgi:hypothetical protein